MSASSEEAVGAPTNDNELEAGMRLRFAALPEMSLTFEELPEPSVRDASSVARSATTALVAVTHGNKN
jgi:hypothetical protein